MSITQIDLDFLTSAQGRSLLAELAQADLSAQNRLSLVTRLRDSYTLEQVSVAVSMAEWRAKAIEKFGNDAHQLLFTDDGLQQASDPLIRQYRATELANSKTDTLRVLDVCCGIGTDSIAFARAGMTVHGIDMDATRIAIAQHNAEVLGIDITFSIQDVTQGIPADYDIIFYDPARRDKNGKRIYDVESYLPPLSLIKTWSAEQIIVKLSPGVDLAQLTDYNGTVEFISVNGDLKEAVLRTPTTESYAYATYINETGVHHWYPQREEGMVIHPTVSLAEPLGWLCEPDPAILRARLVEDVAHAHNGYMLDEQIAYFCTSECPESVWLRAWKIREWLPFNLKKLRARLRQMDVGTLTVKKRGSPITPEELIRKLKLKGTQSATVVLTRYRDQPIAIICDDILTD
ncbi:MAG: class I SAM-dependent methyltransferase [Chloroflexota bacterium]